MPRLDADLRYALQSRQLMAKYVDRKEKLKLEMTVKEAQVTAAKQILAENGVDLEKAVGPSGEPVRRVKSDRVKKSSFRGRKCSISEAIEWAISSFCLADVTPADCPGPSAWALLSFGRKGNNQMIELFKMASRLVRPVAGEAEPEPFRDDGQPIELPDFLKERAAGASAVAKGR